jgi:hypothetical protein
MKKNTKDQKNKGSVHVGDMSGVEAGRKAVPEGKYHVRVAAATKEKAKDNGNDYIKLELAITEGKYKGSKLFHNCSLQPQALFNLKGVMLALGMTIPKKAFDLPLSDMVDLECIVDVVHELYEGKKRPNVTAFFGLDEDDEDEDEDDDDEDDDDEDLEEQLNDLSMKQLKKLAGALEISAAKVKKAEDEEALIAIIMKKDEEEVQDAYDELFGDEDDED